MDLELNSLQLKLQTTAKKLLESRGDLRPAREMLNDPGASGPLAAEVIGLGWPSTGLDVDDPFGVVGLCVLTEQVGRHASPVALVDLAVGARLNRRATEESDGDDPVAALCVLERAADWSLRGLATASTDDAGNVRFSARKLGVHHARSAQLFVVLIELDDEPAAVLVAASAPGVQIEPNASLDPSSAAASVSFDDVVVPAASVIVGRPLRQAMAVGTVATAAEAVGAASRALEMAVEYSLQRSQFGRPIGSFQALGHRLADMYVKREAAWSTVLYAAAAIDERLPDAGASVSIAKAYASAAAREVIEGALQVFGGIGFTWDHDAHLLQRRVLECERRFGDSLDHEQDLMDSHYTQWGPRAILEGDGSGLLFSETDSVSG